MGRGEVEGQVRDLMRDEEIRVSPSSAPLGHLLPKGEGKCILFLSSPREKEAELLSPRAGHRRMKSDYGARRHQVPSIRRKKRRLGALRSWGSDRPVRYGRCLSPPTVGTVCTLITGRFAPFGPRAVTPLCPERSSSRSPPISKRSRDCPSFRRGEVREVCGRFQMRG